MMILHALSDYIKNAQRVEEGKLLKHFHLRQEGLAPIMMILLKRGKIQKTINTRGKKCAPEIYYSWSKNQQIPVMTVV